MPWTELETSTHQDHIIKHVLGATVLGWVIAGDAAHFLLDIGFLWTIYPEGEMSFLPQGVGIAELEGDGLSELDKTELAFDANLLLAEGRDATGLKRFASATTECLVESVTVLGEDSQRRIVIHGEAGEITLEALIENNELSISATG